MELTPLSLRKLLNTSALSLGLSCPRCNSLHFKKHGKHKNIQRFRCKKCNRTFNLTSGTPFHYMHKKEKAISYLQTMQNGLSIRKAAKATNIAIQTSFNWRHKFLIFEQEQNKIKQTTTISSHSTPFSSKGSREKAHKTYPATINLLLHSHNATPRIQRFKTNATVKEITKQLNKATQPQVVITNKLNRKLNKSIKHTHFKINTSQKRFQQIYTEQTCKQTVDHLTIWMKRFKGVSTKYLQHYWNWYTLVLESERFTDNSNIFMSRCVSHKNILAFHKLRKAPHFHENSLSLPNSLNTEA